MKSLYITLQPTISSDIILEQFVVEQYDVPQ